MYFNNKFDTNINNQFDKKSTFNLLNMIKKYKWFIFIIIAIILLIMMFLYFFDRDTGNYLELVGEENIILYQGTDYIEPGFKAYNSKDIDLTSDVDISSNLDVSTVGEYEISYTLNDIVKTRKIVIVEKPKVYTFIRLNAINNNINIYLKLGEEYNDPGYKVYSSTGENLNNKAKVTGTVDTSKKGNYKIVYSLVDSDGVTITASRIVTVMDTEINLYLSTSEYTNNDVTININVIDEYFDYIILPDNSKISKNTYSYKVSKNGTYTFKTYSTKGVTKEQSIIVNNIDKELPTGSCSGSYKDGVSTINISAKDDIGVKKYEIDGITYTNSKINISKELTSVTVKVYDKAGNMKVISCSLKNQNKPKTYYKREFSVKYIDLKNGRGLSYWLYIPEGATDNMPLVIYLHGTEGKGNDYKNNTRKAITYGPGSDIYNNRREFNAIMLMPQTRSGENLNGAELMELVEYIVDTYKINKNKVSLVGMSEGGYHLAVYVSDYANYFSTIVFLATYPYYPEKFVSVPVITVCGELDYERINGMKYFANKINELGGNARHYTLPGLGHTIVDNDDGYSVFRDEKYDLVDWLISQTKK